MAGTYPALRYLLYSYIINDIYVWYAHRKSNPDLLDISQMHYHCTIGAFLMDAGIGVEPMKSSL